jgi:subtilisin family serine protease
MAGMKRAVAAAVLVMAAGLAQADHVRGRVLVKFRDGTDEAVRGRAMWAVRGQAAGRIDGANVEVLNIPQGNELLAARVLKERAEVEFAEVDELRPAATTPNDPGYTGGWQSNLPNINCPAAWDLTRGSTNIVIAVLDTGVDTTHPDLAPNAVPGWNVVSNSADTSDDIGHGTEVAGVVCAATNNGAGVAGVSWGCRMMPVRITAPGATMASFSAIASALNWASQHGARVANCSFQASDSSTVASAAQAFMSHGGVVVMGAGNDGVMLTAPDNPYVLTVSACDLNGSPSSYSDYGNIADRSAPGDVFTTGRGGNYLPCNGTSFASPIVAGVAGLVLSANPSLTGQQAATVIQQSCDDLGSAGWDVHFGAGRVNAFHAVQAALGLTSNPDTSPPSVAIASPTGGASVSGSVTVSINAADNIGVAAVNIAVDGTTVAQLTGPPYSFVWDTSAVTNGTHTLTATALDASQNAASASAAVSVSNSGGDTQAPVVSVSSPAQGQVIGNATAVTVVANDNVGVVRAELYVDGTRIASSTTAPFNMKWNSRRAARGQHTIVVKAFDAASNMGQSATVTVTK